MSTQTSDNISEKRCRKCLTWKKRSEFYSAKGYRDGLHSYCKVCQKAAACASRDKPEGRARQKAWRNTEYRDKDLANQQRYRARLEIKEQHRVYLQAHPEYSRVSSLRYLARKQQSEGGFTTGEWRNLCEHYEHRCLCCGEQKPLEADHVVPLSCGGPNTIDNIQPLCRQCNAKKGSKRIDYR